MRIGQLFEIYEIWGLLGRILEFTLAKWLEMFEYLRSVAFSEYVLL